MKLKQILLYALCTVTMACSKDSADKPEEPNDSTLIKKIVYNEGTTDEETKVFTYEGNKLTTATHNYTKNNYKYENDKLIRVDLFNNNKNEGYITIEYNAEGRIANYTEVLLNISKLGKLIYKSYFTYSGEKISTQKIYKEETNSEEKLLYTYTFTHNNKNYAKKSDGDYEESFEYDDKKGVFRNIHSIEILNILSFTEFGLKIRGIANNVTRFVEKYNTRVGSDETYKYTYNSNDYPETAIATYIPYNETETIKYYYE